MGGGRENEEFSPTRWRLTRPRLVIRDRARYLLQITSETGRLRLQGCAEINTPRGYYSLLKKIYINFPLELKFEFL